jgi:hypothetical protein
MSQILNTTSSFSSRRDSSLKESETTFDQLQALLNAYAYMDQPNHQEFFELINQAGSSLIARLNMGIHGRELTMEVSIVLDRFDVASNPVEIHAENGLHWLRLESMVDTPFEFFRLEVGRVTYSKYFEMAICSYDAAVQAGSLFNQLIKEANKTPNTAGRLN